ncbi:TonB-dependent receptor, partial [candidate division KSB1 bacterium]|nr:TonB-dependent receptor [candidate division KSB1 bacterium]
MKFIFYLLLALSCAADAGIAIVEGEVRDAETGRALDNVTVFFVGGVAKQRTDHNGRFSLEIDGKGVQSLLVQLDDFQTVIENLKMKAGQHSRLDIRISSTEKDGTVAISFRLVPLFSGEDVFASREMLEKLPVENVLQWLVLQPGFVQGHLRGGRADELNRQIDGFDVIDPFYFRSAAVMPELETLDGVSLKSGVSPAEFGGALGGTLAMHTQSEAARHFGRFGVRLGNYITSHDDKFIGLSSSDIDRNVDFRATAGGPIGGDKFGYLANLRYQHNNNHLNGIRRFFVDDYSDFSSSNPEQWYSEHNGDKTFIPMNNEIRLSALGKLNFRPGDRLKAELLFLLNQSQWRDYRHMFKYNPDGLPTSHHRAWMTGLSVDFKPARNINWQTRVAKTALYRGLYVFEDPSDAGYVHDGYLSDSGAGFYTGGQDKVHEKRTLDVLQVKTGLDWRLKGTHFLKAGIDYKQYTLDNEESDIVNRFSGTSKAQQRRFDSERRKMVYLNYDPLLDGDGEFYTFEPLEISAFMQDRIELENMVLEAGVRFDQFESGGFYPSDYSDPANRTVFGNSVRKKVKAKTRFSPRAAAVFSPQSTTHIRLAYGHFYQMPPFYTLYADPDYLGAYTTYSNVLGNADLEPQKKIEYEAGVQHEMSAFLNLRMTIFSREYS